MFNLAQRQLTVSLWRTESARRSTCKESKQEKEALWCNGYRTWVQTSLNYCLFPVVSVRRTAAPSYLLLCLYFTLFQHVCETTNWDNPTSTYLLLFEITWCSVAIKYASLSWFIKYQSTQVINNKKLSFSAARECFYFT